MSRRTGLAVLVAVLALTVAGAGCGASAGSQQEGKTALIALIQEPGLMSPLFNDQSGSDLAYAFVLEPLFLVTPKGEYEPYLAAEVPTTQNGGVSADGLTVTYRLKDGITWSDGTPFTAEDIAFTVEALQDPQGTPPIGPEYELVESAEVIDKLTVEVTMTQPNPGHLELFAQVLPKHKFGSTAVAKEDPSVRLPLGTGPFVFKEWLTGDRITLERNPRYWRDPNLPYLDGINVKITPDKQSAFSSFTKGEYDSVYFVTSADLPDLMEAEKNGAAVKVDVRRDELGPVEWLWLNHSDHGDPTRPHPVLGDPKVREAIDHGINRQAITDEVLSGFSALTGSLIYSGWAAVERPATPYDPERAKRILDEAGWRPGPDGIRVKDGVRASLRFQTISGDETRATYQQLVQQDMKAIGIELQIQNVPSNVMFGGWGDGGLLATGNYDIMMSRDGRYPDPAAWVAAFTSSRIPSDQNPNGTTNSHWRNPTYDQLVHEAESTLDQARRKQLYDQIGELFATERVALPLYSSVWGYAWNPSLDGVDTGYWDGMWTTASSAQWQLK
jgi:peptide/nickel transport system substrate-binding protein